MIGRRKPQFSDSEMVELADVVEERWTAGRLTPQERHHGQILADFQTAVRTNDEATRCLRHAEAVAAQAALALVESRKQVRRVSDGTI